MPAAAHIELAHSAARPGAGHGDLVHGVVLVQLKVVEYVVRAVPDGGPDGELLLRVDHMVGAVAEEEFRVAVPGGAGDHHFCSHVLQEGGRFQRALEIIADGDDAKVEIGDAQRGQERGVRAVPDEAPREVGQRHIDALLHALHGEHLIVKLPELFRYVTAEAAQSDEQYRFHNSSCEYQPTATFSSGSRPAKGRLSRWAA